VKYLVIALTAAACLTGLLSAWYWQKASLVPVDPGWGANGLVEPGVHSLSQDAWIAAMLRASLESARLNKIAARWTAVTAALTAIAALTGVLKECC
jgi:hypothetical protein